MEIKCPITNEVVATFGKEGFIRRANYREIFYVLEDHSRMKLIISKNAKDNLKDSQLNNIFKDIQQRRINNLKGKSFDKEKKDLAIERLSKSGYNLVVDKSAILIDKKVLIKKQ
jgi:hypothetical protein